MAPPGKCAANPAQDQGLCLACGLCCNGVLFADVELQETDDPAALSRLGLPLKIQASRRRSETAAATIRFPQPCAALVGCRCTIYDDRPARCRHFDCALLLGVRQGKIDPETALRRIRETRKVAAKVQRLMKELGDRNESMALSLRFQRLRRLTEAGGLADEAMADAYAELTLGVHDLQQRLRKHFYP